MERNSTVSQLCIRLLGVSSVESSDTTKGSAIRTSTGSLKCGSNGSSGGLEKRIKSG